MVRIHDAHLTTEQFDFQVNKSGIVQLSFGATHVCMSLDAAYELQYQLASFLANIELSELPPETPDEPSEISENRKVLTNLSNLAAYRKKKSLDS